MTPYEAKIREVENNVLDQHHMQFDLLMRSNEAAIKYVLSVYGQILRDFERHRGEGAQFRRQRYVINNFTHALSHCFRWIDAEAERNVDLPDASRERLEEEAEQLLLWAAQYESLAADHSAWSRGLISAEVDEESKTIVFRHPETAAALTFVQQIEAQQALTDQAQHAPPISALQADFQKWLESAKHTPRVIHLPWDTGDRSNIIDAITHWLENSVWPELEPQSNLGGFTLANFHSVFGFLYVICLYRAWAEDLGDRFMANSRLFRAETLQASSEKFVEWIAQRTGVSIDAVDPMVDLLTFDTSNRHAKLSNQPLIRSKQGTLFLLPRFFTQINPARMLAGAINKSKNRAVYDHLAQQFEQRNLETIECTLRKVTDFEIVREKTLSDCHVVISPDFFIFDPATNALLIIDFKHVLSPYSTADVHHKLKDFEKWRPKMRAYMSFAASHIDLMLPHLPSLSAVNPPVITGMILTRWPLPIPVELDEDMCMGDWASLQRWLDKNGVTSVDDLKTWAKVRPDVNTPTSFRYEPKDFVVGDWTYRRMTIVSD